MPETEDSGSAIFYRGITEFRGFNPEAPCFSKKGTYSPDSKTCLIGWILGIGYHWGSPGGQFKIIHNLLENENV